MRGLAARSLCVRLSVALTLAALVQAGALAQEVFPGGKPIELTVLFPAGTSADVTARVLADGMSKQLNTNVLVVNRPGAGGAIGYKYVAGQSASGHHLVWNSNSVSTTFHTGMMAFDYRAFVPVARVLVETPLLVVKSDAPWKDLRELIAYAKNSPGKLAVGNSGAGSHTHFSAVMLFKAAGVEVTDVPFGAAQVIPSLLGGHVNAAMQLPGALAALVRSGNLRVVAALATRRDAAFAEVPTAIEQGVNVAADAWRGVAAPRGTPAAAVARLEEAIRKTVVSPEFAKACENLSVAPAFLPGANFGRLIAREDSELAVVIESLGLKKSAH